jgi:aerobic carbon-monoxide dehydrogenase medium subunit
MKLRLATPTVLVDVGGPGGGERTIGARGLCTGFLETCLGPDEMLTEIRVPKLPGVGFSYQKFQRRAQDWAIVGAMAVRNGDTRVALVNMGDINATPEYREHLARVLVRRALEAAWA